MCVAASFFHYRPLRDKLWARFKKNLALTTRRHNSRSGQRRETDRQTESRGGERKTASEGERKRVKSKDGDGRGRQDWFEMYWRYNPLRLGVHDSEILVRY